MLEHITYDNFDTWQEGVYRSRHEIAAPARSFKMVHEERTEDCWLLVHGYRGYPGEMVSPAYTLFNAGFDVFVPRLPGHGSCGDDFERCSRKDWFGLVRNAISELKGLYRHVNLLGHSMGSSLAVTVGSSEESCEKIIIAAPTFVNKYLGPKAKLRLRLASIFTPRIPNEWEDSTKYHYHFEGAPEGVEQLADEYFRWYYTRGLFDYDSVGTGGLKWALETEKQLLILCPMKDYSIAVPATELYLKKGGDEKNVVRIEGGTHCIFYDKIEAAEEAALKAIEEFARK